MLIGNWNIASAGGTQWNVEFGHCDIATESEWTKGSAIPFFLAGTLKLKQLKITIKVDGINRQDILHKRSLILSKLLDPVELILDGYDRFYYGIMTRHSEVETVMERWHKVTIQFDCIEYDYTCFDEMDSTTRMRVNNPGNIKTPFTLEITPKSNISTLTVSGACRDRYTKQDLPITISNLRAGKTILIDAESELITEDGALKSADVDIWEVPSLEPGQNTITFSSAVDVRIKYRPYYM